MNPKLLLALLLAIAPLAASFTAMAHGQSQSSTNATIKPSTNPHAGKSHPPEPDDEGQTIFLRNCSRCHSAPEGFSPRISATIVRHMRVRASLSQHDERAILHFLNP